MKGIIFNLLEQLVTAEHGEDTWDDTLQSAGVEGAYTALGNYPDTELMALVGAVATQSEQSADEVLRWFGRGAMPILASSFPTFFVGHESLWTFLPTINEVIHAEVRKLYPGAETPWFEVDTADGDSIKLNYSSGRRLCVLAEGFLEGAAAHFGETVRIVQPECMLKGDARCVLACFVGVSPS